MCVCDYYRKNSAAEVAADIAKMLRWLINQVHGDFLFQVHVENKRKTEEEEVVWGLGL